MADNQCAAGIMAFNYNQHAPITSIAFRAQDNDAYGDNMYFEFTVNKTYTCKAAPAGDCLLVCSGDQNVTLAGGECTYTVPNLVTMAGPCLDGAVLPAPVVGFSGPFAYANRYFHNTALGSDPGYGNLACTTTTGLPNTLVLQSADVLGGGNSCSWYGTVVSWTVPANSTISFNWATSTSDPFWDNFGYSTTLNPNTPTGMFFASLQSNTTVLADVTSSGTRSIPVSAGQIFSFVNYTEDGSGGALTATIGRVLVPPLLAILFVVTLLTVIGEHLSLFHLVSLLLVLGVGLNYALFFNRPFSDEEEKHRTWLSLTVCMLATLSAFGALAFSRTRPSCHRAPVGLGAAASLAIAAIFGQHRVSR